MTFEEWIDLVGPKKIAKSLNVCPATIRHWRAWRCDPHVAQVRKIKRLSRGLLGYEQIIDRRGTPPKTVRG